MKSHSNDDTILEREEIDSEELLREVGLRPSRGSRIFNIDEYDGEESDC